MASPEPRSVLFGNNSVRTIEQRLDELDVRRLFLVTGRTSWQLSGAAPVLDGVFARRARMQILRFNDFQHNPVLQDVERGVDLARRFAPDAFLAVGGGSVIDMAKLINACGAQTAPPIEYVTGRRTLERGGRPLIAVPTTSGSGSEATHFAVVYVEGRKHSLAHASILPHHALIDPGLTLRLPPGITASSGMDALCQATESVWATGADERSMGYALRALQRALDHLEAAVSRPDPAARAGMAEAAHLSGRAINISKTTAPHAISYGISALGDVPHGFAVSLTLGAFLSYNARVNDADCTDPRGAAAVRARIQRLCRAFGGSEEVAQQRLEMLRTRIGCPMRLRDAGVRDRDLPRLVAGVNAQRLANNPRTIGPDRLLALLRDLL